MMLWEIQEGPLGWREICNLEDNIVLREFWAQFSASDIIYIF